MSISHVWLDVLLACQKTVLFYHAAPWLQGGPSPGSLPSDLPLARSFASPRSDVYAATNTIAYTRWVSAYLESQEWRSLCLVLNVIPRKAVSHPESLDSAYGKHVLQAAELGMKKQKKKQTAEELGAQQAIASPGLPELLLSSQSRQASPGINTTTIVIHLDVWVHPPSARTGFTWLVNTQVPWCGPRASDSGGWERGPGISTVRLDTSPAQVMGAGGLCPAEPCLSHDPPHCALTHLHCVTSVSPPSRSGLLAVPCSLEQCPASRHSADCVDSSLTEQRLG